MRKNYTPNFSVGRCCIAEKERDFFSGKVLFPLFRLCYYSYDERPNCTALSPVTTKVVPMRERSGNATDDTSTVPS